MQRTQRKLRARMTPYAYNKRLERIRSRRRRKRILEGVRTERWRNFL